MFISHKHDDLKGIIGFLETNYNIKLILIVEIQECHYTNIKDINIVFLKFFFLVLLLLYI